MRIPVMDGPEVAPEPLPTVREHFDVPNNLGAVAHGMSELAEGTERLDVGLQIAQQKADVAAATGALSTFQNGGLDKIYGSADGKTKGLLSLQGEDAVAQSAPTLDALQKDQQRVASTLQNDTQRRLFMAHSNEWLLAQRRAVEGYVNRQVQVVQEQRANALGATAVRTAASAYDNDEAADTAFTSARDALLASMHGVPVEAQQAAITKLRGDMASARIQSALGAQDVATADRLLQTHREDLGPAAPQLEHQVTAMRDSLASDAQTKDILGSSTDKGYPWVDEAAALAKVQALPPGKLKDETEQRVEHQLFINRQMKEQAGRDKLNNLQAIYAQSGDPTVPRMAPIRAWMMDPKNGAAGLLEQFDRGVQVEQRASRASDAEERRAQQQQDQLAFETYMAQPVEERAKLDVDKQFLGQASNLGRARIKAQQQRDVSAVSRGAQEGEVEFFRDIRTQAASAGLDNGGPVAKQPRLQSLLGAMNSWRQNQLLQPNGKPPTRDDVRKELAHQLQLVNPGWYRSNKFRFELGAGEDYPAADQQPSPLNQPGQKVAPASAPAAPPASSAPSAPTEPADIAPATRLHIIRVLTSKGVKQPTEQQIQKVYAMANGVQR